MKKVTMYTTSYCPYCVRAKALLDSLGIPYQEINVEHDEALRDSLIEKYQWQTVPIIVIGNECIGGSDDLHRLHAEGKLQTLLQNE